jgi:hypothetical protein
MALFVDHISKTDPTLKTNLIAHWKAAVPLAKAKKLNLPWASEIKSATTFSDLIFHALGSKINPKVNALCDKKVNGFKADIWVGDEPVEKKKHENLVTAVLNGKTDSAKIHSVHRNVSLPTSRNLMSPTKLTIDRSLACSIILTISL